MRRLQVPELEKSTSVLTTQDYDEYNAVYAILRKVFPKHRKSNFETLKNVFFKRLDLSGLDFPLNLNHLKKFVLQNKWVDISLKVLLYHNGKCYPQVFFNCGSHSVVLLYVKLPISENKTENYQNHYFLLQNPDAFLSSKYRNSKTNTRKSYFCLNCLCKFSSQSCRDKHEQNCSSSQQPQKVVLPKGNNGEKPYLSFKAFKATYMTPVCAFADFESNLIKLKHCSNCAQEVCTCDVPSLTQKLNRHEAISWAIVFVTSQGEVIAEQKYTGESAVEKFLEFLTFTEPFVKKYIQQYRDYMSPLTSEEQQRHEAAEVCYICQQKFLNDEDGKVHDHDHMTSRYIAASHR